MNKDETVKPNPMNSDDFVIGLLNELTMAKEKIISLNKNNDGLADVVLKMHELQKLADEAKK